MASSKGTMPTVLPLPLPLPLPLLLCEELELVDVCVCGADEEDGMVKALARV